MQDGSSATPDGSQAPLNPLALSLADAARLFSSIGGREITEADLREDVAAGAPVGPGGTLNLLHYGAWLVHGLELGFASEGEPGGATAPGEAAEGQEPDRIRPRGNTPLGSASGQVLFGWMEELREPAST